MASNAAAQICQLIIPVDRVGGQYSVTRRQDGGETKEEDEHTSDEGKARVLSSSSSETGREGRSMELHRATQKSGWTLRVLKPTTS